MMSFTPATFDCLIKKPKDTKEYQKDKNNFDIYRRSLEFNNFVAYLSFIFLLLDFCDLDLLDLLITFEKR